MSTVSSTSSSTSSFFIKSNFDLFKIHHQVHLNYLYLYYFSFSPPQVWWTPLCANIISTNSRTMSTNMTSTTWRRIFLRTREKYNRFWKEKLLPLTKEELKSHQDARRCYIWRKRILKKLTKSKDYQKLRYHCHYIGKCSEAAHTICNLRLMCLMKFLWFFTMV